MSTTVFTEMKFWLLIVFSLVLPVGIYGVLLAKRAISRYTVLFIGFTLVVIAGFDVYLLQSLVASVRRTIRQCASFRPKRSCCESSWAAARLQHLSP